ncbi:sigma-70 family RNA polymerase sigma factor [Magnetospirillum moscoviense]|uniref:RNA polymerase subunit sigma n=1 Tax=Magnetospirillum moscoviense TaxID=1437059 RepID=A0A178MMR2_9PROT|nr:sigma-70 family RNA polymerase sigma factor [Magnetospirillum moscoviense]OAN49833.1 RNA polymerase subunit sigma [Magnetospirillum moscoviense]
MDQDSQWRAWMAAAQAGDKAAYGRLLADLVPVVRRLVGRRWHGAADAEDVVQDALLTLHAVRHTYDPTRPFLPWLAAIVERRVADGLRKRYRRSGREEEFDEAAETFSAIETNIHALDAEPLRRAVADLPAGQRQAIELVKLKEMSLAEASAASGQSVGALKVAVHRAIKALKEKLDR